MGGSPKTQHEGPAIRTFWAHRHREHTCPDPPPGGARRVRGVPAAWTSAYSPQALVQTHFLRISCPLPGPSSQGPLLVTDPQGVQILSPSPFLPASYCSGAVTAYHKHQGCLAGVSWSLFSPFPCASCPPPCPVLHGKVPRGATPCPVWPLCLPPHPTVLAKSLPLQGWL